MKYITSIAIFFSIPVLVFAQATWYVPDDFPTIQGAISDPSVVNGDTIIVRQGTYMENLDFLAKAIVVKSEHGPGVTIIDGNQSGSVVCFQSGEGLDSMLDGFTVTNGDVYGSGGGIYCQNASPTICNNIIKENRAEHAGGGICCSKSSALISQCIIEKNAAYGSASILPGGGIHCAEGSPFITQCTISNNSGDAGGGIACYMSSPTITRNIISNNESQYEGAGICCCFFSSTIAGNIITGNTALRGAGIFCDNSSPTIMNNTITENSASEGGGILCYWYSSPVITNTILWSNPECSQAKRQAPVSC